MTEPRVDIDEPVTLTHDGSWPGYLCACAEALNAPEPVPRVVGYDAPLGLFESRMAVARDDGRAAALWDRLTAKAGVPAMRIVLEAFLSERPDARTNAAVVIRRLRRDGADALRDLADPVVLSVDKAANRSRREAERTTGIARLSELADGSWYAPLEPECDVLPLVADHFAARFAAMRFALHDLRRGRAVLHEPGRPWLLADGFALNRAGSDGEGDGAPGYIDPGMLSSDESRIRDLWRRYFSATAIEGRLNPGLQSAHIPKKYWRLLTEMGRG